MTVEQSDEKHNEEFSKTRTVFMERLDVDEEVADIPCRKDSIRWKVAYVR